MLRLLYFEFKKDFLRRFIIVSTLLSIVINVLYIWYDYFWGDSGPFSYFWSHTKKNYKIHEFYAQMYDKLDGELTKEKADFVVNENARLESITKDLTFSTEYNPDSYTGYLWSDYVLFNKYFYSPMKYMALYGLRNKEVVEKARENIGFYKKYGNKFEISKNEFIVTNYFGRNISYFYETQHWAKLLDYKLSDFLIILLAILGLTPIYVYEKETNMHELIASNLYGKISLSNIKILSSVIYVSFLVITFSSINIIAVGTLYGFNGLNMPLYAVEQYQYTPYSGSVLSFYLLFSLLKLLGMICFTMIILCISAVFRHEVFSYIFSMLAFFWAAYFSAVIYSRRLWGKLSLQ